MLLGGFTCALSFMVYCVPVFLNSLILFSFDQVAMMISYRIRSGPSDSSDGLDQSYLSQLVTRPFLSGSVCPVTHDPNKPDYFYLGLCSWFSDIKPLIDLNRQSLNSQFLFAGREKMSKKPLRLWIRGLVTRREGASSLSVYGIPYEPLP